MENKDKDLRYYDSNRSLALQVFDVWFSGYSKYIKEFDFSESREDLMDDILERILSGKISCLKELSQAIFKSYYIQDKEGATRFLSTKSKKSASIIPSSTVAALLEEKLGISIKDKPLTHEESYELISKVFADELERRSKSLLHVDMASNLLDSKIISLIANELQSRGAKEMKLGGKKIYRMPNRAKKEFAQGTDFYVYEYKTIVENFVKKCSDFNNIYRINGNGKEVTDFWAIIKDSLQEIEEIMPEEAKTDKTFLKAKKEADHFFNEAFENLYQKHTKEGKYGAYYIEVQDAVKRWKDGTANDKENQIIVDFLYKVKDVNMALRIVDKNGKNYPLNYFICMPMAPDAYAKTLSDIIRIGKLKPTTLNFLIDTKTLVKTTFAIGSHNYAFSDTKEELETIFKMYRGIIEKDGKILDTSTDEGLEKVLNLGQEYIEKYNLPKSRVCYNALAKELFTTERREPVCLPKAIESKYLKEDKTV